MTQNKTKKALLMSVLSMVLCVAMLVGMTFAWFTDTASTGVNRIQAGNLKMEVTYKNTRDGAFNELTKGTNVFKTDTLWEPGHVEYAVLNVKNVGTLALKYKLGINIAKETPSTNVDGDQLLLSNYIRFAVVDSDKSGLDRANLISEAEAAGSKLIKDGYTKENNLNENGKSDIVTLVVWMPESVGNEANYRGNTVPTIELGIKVDAKQYTYEADSFDNTYDADATYPVQDAASLKKALDEVNGSETVDSAILVLTDNFSYGNETLAVSGGKDVTIDLAGKNLTIANTSGDGLEVNNGNLTLANSGSSGTYTFDCTAGGSDGIYVHNTEAGKTTEVTIAADVEIKVNAGINSAIHAYGEEGNAVVNIEDGAKVTVNGNSQTSAIIVDQNATLNINGGEFDMNVDFDSFRYSNDVVGVLVWGQNGAQSNCHVNVNGGIFKVGGKNAFAQGIQIGAKNYVADNCTVNMTGGNIILSYSENGKGYAFTAAKTRLGKFTMSGGSVTGTITAITTTQDNDNADLTVTGGTFSVDPTAYVNTDTHKITQTGNVWNVTKK